MNARKFDERTRVDYALQNRPALLDRLLREPAAVLDELGVDEAALACTDEAHAAYERSAAVAERANALGADSLVEALPKLADVMRDGLGPRFRHRQAAVRPGVPRAHRGRDGNGPDRHRIGGVHLRAGVQAGRRWVTRTVLIVGQADDLHVRAA